MARTRQGLTQFRVDHEIKDTHFLRDGRIWMDILSGEVFCCEQDNREGKINGGCSLLRGKGSRIVPAVQAMTSNAY